MVEIVKVQVSLSPTTAPAMVYAKDRGRLTLLDALPAHVRTQLRGQPKGYFKANWLHGRWHLGDRVEDQPW